MFYRLDGVTVSRPLPGGGTKNILDAVSFQVPPGARWTVLGVSGAGKSTLLRLFNRMVEPVRGTVYVEGKNLAEEPPARVRRRVALVFQEPVWLPGTARDNLFAVCKLGLATEEEAASRLDRVLELAGIDRGLLDRTEDELSVGQRQRIALGRALMTRPRGLLLDEPTRGIDVGAKNEIYHLMNRLAAEGRGIVFVSSYLPEILGMADSVYVMCRGALSRKFRVDEVDQERVMALATGIAPENNYARNH